MCSEDDREGAFMVSDARLWQKVQSSTTPLMGKNQERVPPKRRSLDSSPADMADLLSSPRRARDEMPPRAAKNLAKNLANNSVRNFPQESGADEKRVEPAPHIMRRIKRGAVSVDGRLDLHGMRQEEAHRALFHFLQNQRAMNARLVLIITGQGKQRDIADKDPLSPQPGILRKMLPVWLNSQGMGPLISRYSPAHSRHGGQGAFYVWLRKAVRMDL